MIGGSWKHLVTESTTGSSGASPYLTFIVALHVATAIALLVCFRVDWVRIIAAFFTTLRTRRVATSSQRLVWLIVVATIPAGLTGLAFEHPLRTLFAKPTAAAVFLIANGCMLLAGERLRRRSAALVPAAAIAEGRRQTSRAARSRLSPTVKPALSACSRPLPCSPASAVPGSQWWPGCYAG